MLESVRALAEALAGEDASVSDLVAHLDGRVTEHPGNVIVDEPRLDGIASGNVVRHGPGEDRPANVRLELREPLDLEPLAARLGEPRTVYPDHAGGPVQLVYPRPLVDGPRPVKLIARSEAGEPAGSIMLRRD